MLVAMDGGEQAYRDVLAAVFGRATPVPARLTRYIEGRLKPWTNSQVKGFQAGYQEEEFLERRNTPQDLH
uniref:Uncharacterized protein n=1 Tax=Marinobacter nauticus TaxID=2743 RepID=A0A455WH82_MARNT|nr:hypothetical protein YBY_38240 [Marinobacter nauticus]